MIEHCVFCKLRADADPTELEAIFAGLKALCADLPGALRFASGPNRDYEGKSPDVPAGFVITFETPAALARYADHRIHKALGARLCALCIGGAGGIVVYDLETG